MKNANIELISFYCWGNRVETHLGFWAVSWFLSLLGVRKLVFHVLKKNSCRTADVMLDLGGFIIGGVELVVPDSVVATVEVFAASFVNENRHRWRPKPPTSTISHDSCDMSRCVFCNSSPFRKTHAQKFHTVKNHSSTYPEITKLKLPGKK